MDPRATRSDIEKAIDQVDLLLDTPHTGQIAAYFRERIASSDPQKGVPPAGYLMFETLTIHDLQKGIKGSNGEATPRQASGLMPMVYGVFTSTLRLYLPEDFQAALKDLDSEIGSELAALTGK